jgi:hypothetical protein
VSFAIVTAAAPPVIAPHATVSSSRMPGGRAFAQQTIMPPILKTENIIDLLHFRKKEKKHLQHFFFSCPCAFLNRAEVKQVLLKKTL